MKKLLLLVGILFLARSARAEAVFDVGVTSHAVTGVVCTTGTVVQINLTRPTGFASKVTGWRVQNQDSGDSAWIGGLSVSTSAASNLGFRLVAGDDVTYPLGYNPINSAEPPLYCRAEDAAGAAAVLLSVEWFGY